MNALNREIQKGEQLVVRANVMLDGYKALDQRVFIAEGGFGMSPQTMGQAIVGKWWADGLHDRIEGSEIDVKETEAWQREQKQIEAHVAAAANP